MSEPRFDWDPAKAAANERKHGVSFAEAETVFSDDHALVLDDPDQSTRSASFSWDSARDFACSSWCTAIELPTTPFG